MKDLLVLIGGLIGGTLGWLAFFWLTQQGFYALALPGGLVGLGASVARARLTATAVSCGVIGLTLSVLAEWRFAPFVVDDSLMYFLAHMHKLKPLTLIMIVVGTVIAFVLPFRNRQRDVAGLPEPVNKP